LAYVGPRLELVGADLSRVHIMKAVREGDGTRHTFNLGRDLSLLGDLIERIGDVVLVVIDPITAYMGEKVDSHRATSVRAVLEPLAYFVEGRRCALFCITHPPKSAQSKATNSFIGSQAFAAAARVALLACDEPDAEDDRRLLLGVRVSNGRLPTGIGYRVVEGMTDRDIKTCRIAWDDAPVDVTANEAVRHTGESERQAGRREAQEFLRQFLRDGPRTSEEVHAEAEAEGISVRTLKRAKKELGIVSEKEKGVFDRGSWKWRLP
jgi:AAA domain-containing protein